MSAAKLSKADLAQGKTYCVFTDVGLNNEERVVFLKILANRGGTLDLQITRWMKRDA